MFTEEKHIIMQKLIVENVEKVVRAAIFVDESFSGEHRFGTIPAPPFNRN